ncbi:hypothetical protein QX249_12120 [Vibrio parahaemolyticus]|uniref:Uncharacterized protein n=1 Tax=Vibrio parahaemolyticus TaxID=670 RepID=A0AAW8Q0L4_VIBPH|nr:hypothetical protein [Vibrio parahaemolyticus]EGR2227360.1 hypothetical protein [Vibrio parahaemolyticus]MDS1821408.1 hypothetical protein [Vibrio parahaemolyticus]
MFSDLDKEILLLIKQGIKKNPISFALSCLTPVSMMLLIVFSDQAIGSLSLGLLAFCFMLSCGVGISVNLFFWSVISSEKKTIFEAIGGMSLGWLLNDLRYSRPFQLFMATPVVLVFLIEAYIRFFSGIELGLSETNADTESTTSVSILLVFYRAILGSFILYFYGVRGFLATNNITSSLFEISKVSSFSTDSNYMICAMKLCVVPALLIQLIFHFIGESAGVECALLFSSLVGATIVAHSRGDRPKAEEKEMDVSGETVNSF